MNRKHILAVSAIAFSLAVSGSALANGGPGGPGGPGGGDDDGVSVTVGDVALTYAPAFTSTKTVKVSKVIADQELKGVIVNKYLDDVLDTDKSGGYDSGDNEIHDNAFAAFAGILNLAWNTGFNANNQAATNIAAKGNVTFGNVGCCETPVD